MTMIDPTPATPVIPDEMATISKYDLQTLQDSNTSLRNSYSEQRNLISKLYRELNEMISNDGLSESDEISFGDLSLVLSGIFDRELEFVKEYDVQVTFTVYANLTIKATSQEEAENIADNISLSVDEDDLDVDDDTTTIDETYIDSTNVEYCREN